MLGNLHVRFGVGAGVELPGPHHYEFRVHVESPRIRSSRRARNDGVADKLMKQFGWEGGFDSRLTVGFPMRRQPCCECRIRCAVWKP